MATHRRRKKNPQGLVGLALTLTLVLVALLIVVAVLPANTPPAGEPTDPTISLSTESSQPSIPPITDPSEATVPTEPPIRLESTATLAATGDMLMHKPIIDACLTSEGEYDFSSIFTYFSDYVSKADYAVANLETTLAGSGNGYKYSGYPQFNCPDSIAHDLKDSGFDMLLTANNHTYDTRTVGLTRTQQIIRDMGLACLGTKPTADAPNYFIADVNGIRIGMLCYTYEDDHSAEGKAPNSHKMSPEDAALINSFDYSNLPLFYEEMAQNMADMNSAGVDAVVMFIHWGAEYKIQHNSTQSAIAQELCNLGVDVIIGGHSHVVQPVELLTATDGSHKTVCLYSMGNAVSNQRVYRMDLKTGHTEDGVLFSVTFNKYSDGTVILSDVNLLPTWVDLREPAKDQPVYTILPLDKQVEDWKTQFGLTDETLKNAQDSYDRTMAIVGSGMAEAKEYLAQKTAQTEADLGIN